MNRDEFCSVLELEYQRAQDQWSQALQAFRPLASIWPWLQQAKNSVKEPYQQIILFLIDIHNSRSIILKERLDYCTARKHQVYSALLNIRTSNIPYYHLSHFNESDFSQYYTDSEPLTFLEGVGSSFADY